MTVFADYTAAATEIDAVVTDQTSSDRVVHTELGSTLKRVAETLFGIPYNQMTIGTTDPPTGGVNGDVAWSVTNKIYTKTAGSWVLTNTLVLGRYTGSHDPTASYLQNDLVYYSNDFYRANKNNGPAAFTLTDFDLAFNTPHSIVTTGPIGSDAENPSLAEISTWYDANVGPALTFDYPQSVLDRITYTTPIGRVLAFVRYTTTWTQVYFDSPALAVTQNDFTDPDYFYHGGTITGWQINRYDKATLTKTLATEVNNPGHTSLSTAWAARTSLTYEVVP